MTLFYLAEQHGWRRPSSRQRASQQASTEDRQDNSERPTIRIAGGNLPAVVTAAEKAMIDAGMGLYQRGSLIVRPASTSVAVADGDEQQLFA